MLTRHLSWLPLLFIPTNASPAFIFLFFVCTYFLHRPCVYCSILLIILFLTSCNWSDRCFFDFSSNWFLPRPSTTSTMDTMGAFPNDTAALYSNASSLSAATADGVNETMLYMLNSTAKGLVRAAADKYAPGSMRPEWTGLGLGWLRDLLGQREWRIECMDLYIRL
jgi:hypothetical protein